MKLVPEERAELEKYDMEVEACRMTLEEYHASKELDRAAKLQTMGPKARRDSERKRKKYLEYPDRQREYSRAYNAAHREEKLEYARRWRAAHADEVKAYNAAWKASNPERVREYNKAVTERRRSERNGESIRDTA